MNLFKILFLFSLIVGLDYHGGAQNCEPGCVKIQACKDASTSKTKAEIGVNVNREMDPGSVQGSNNICDPSDCPPICRLLCKAVCNKERMVSAPTLKDKAESAMVLTRLPATEIKVVPVQSVSLD